MILVALMSSVAKDRPGGDPDAPPARDLASGDQAVRRTLGRPGARAAGG